MINDDICFLKLKTFSLIFLNHCQSTENRSNTYRTELNCFSTINMFSIHALLLNNVLKRVEKKSTHFNLIIVSLFVQARFE